jgi:prefoldin subunit 5
MEAQMDIEQRVGALEDLLEKLQEQISELNRRVKNIDDELVTVDREMNFQGERYPSLFDAKKILVEKGWLKKP